MAAKKTKPTKHRRKTDLVPDTEPRTPLDGEPWIGHDNARWIDLAVDSRNRNVILWLRKRVKSAQYFLVASCVGAHILKKELTQEEAMALFPSLPDRAPFNVCFPGKGKIEGGST
jgi:hypothetical protein